MNLDLITLITMLIIMSLFGIGILLCLIIIWSDQCTTPEEQEYEDQEQIKYIKDYQKRKLIRKNKRKETLKKWRNCAWKVFHKEI